MTTPSAPLALTLAASDGQRTTGPSRSIRPLTDEQITRADKLQNFFYYYDQIRLVNDTSNLFQHYFTSLFLWSLVTICGAFLIIQMQMV